jgi:hypothetical protein
MNFIVRCCVYLHLLFVSVVLVLHLFAFIKFVVAPLYAIVYSVNKKKNKYMFIFFLDTFLFL